MRIKLAPHARDRLKERGISGEIVKTAIESPDTQATSKHGGGDRLQATKTIGRYRYTIIYRPSQQRKRKGGKAWNSPHLVITAFKKRLPKKRKT